MPNFQLFIQLIFNGFICETSHVNGHNNDQYVIDYVENDLNQLQSRPFRFDI